jgi:hypothetical protein
MEFIGISNSHGNAFSPMVRGKAILQPEEWWFDEGEATP